MALENKLGLTSSVDLAREEERIINISLTKFMILPEKSEPRMSQGANSVLHL